MKKILLFSILIFSNLLVADLPVKASGLFFNGIVSDVVKGATISAGFLDGKFDRKKDRISCCCGSVPSRSPLLGVYSTHLMSSCLAVYKMFTNKNMSLSSNILSGIVDYCANCSFYSVGYLFGMAYKKMIKDVEYN